MSKIDIQVKKEASFNQRNSNHLDLKKATPLIQKQPRKKRLFLVFLIVVILILLIKIFFFAPKEEISLNKLIPQEAAIFSLIEQRVLVEGTNYPFNQDILNKFNHYLGQANLDLAKDILPLFQEPVAFASLSANLESFILLLQKQAAPEQIEPILKRLEQALKNDYQFSYQIYRQNKIIILKPLEPDGLPIYYSQIEDYLMMSNSLEWMEQVIDLIIQS